MVLIFKNEARKDGNLSEYQTKLLSNHEGLSIDMLMYMIQVLSEIRRKAKDDRHKRILLEVAITKLTTTEEISAINDIVNRIENIEKKLSTLFKNHTNDFDSANGIEEKNSNQKGTCSKIKNDVQYGKENRIERLEPKPEENESNIEPKSSPSESKELKNNTNYDKESIWQNIMARVQSKKKSLWAVLQEGKFIGHKNRQIVVEFPSDFRIHKERLEKPDEKKIIEEYAEAIIGEKVKLKLTLSEKPKRKDAGNEAAITRQEIDNKTSHIGVNRINNDLTINDDTIINNDCVQKAIKIFDGRIVDIRRIEK